MSVVISVRIPKELKEKLDSLRDIVNWSEEIRNFLERRVREYYKKRVIEEVHQVIERFPECPTGTAVKYIREDRDDN